MRSAISDVLDSVYEQDYVTVDTGVSGDTHLVGHNLRGHINELEKRMKQAAGELEFEEAARLRDEIRRLEAMDLGLDKSGVAPRAAARGGWTPQRGRKRGRTRRQ